jgi:hypothetical protein
MIYGVDFIRAKWYLQSNLDHQIKDGRPRLDLVEMVRVTETEWRRRAGHNGALAATCWSWAGGGRFGERVPTRRSEKMKRGGGGILTTCFSGSERQC